MAEENGSSIENKNERAGIILRFTASLIDFFLFFTSGTYFFFVPNDDTFGIFLIMVSAAVVVFEIVLQDTPAKRLLRMKVIYERKSFGIYLLRPFLKYLLGIVSFLFIPFNRKRQWLHDRLTRTTVVRYPSRYWNLRAIGVILLVVNIFLTFGVGNIVWKSISQEIDFKRVGTVPERVSLQQVPVSVDEPILWNEGWRIRPPRNFKGMKMERSNRMSCYDITYNDQERGLGIFVLLEKLFHPCIKCVPETDNVWRLVFPCRQSPKAVQDAVFDVSLKDRYFAWNPLDMIRTNMRLFEKDVSTNGIGDDFVLRRLERNGISIVWVFSEIEPDVEATVPLRFFKDILYLATSSTYGELIVLWKDRPRDEQLVWKLIDTLELWEPGPADIDREFQLALKYRSIPHAVNAFRMSDGKYETGEFLFQLLSEKGTTFEKRAFSLTIPGLKDRRYKKLAYLTRDWQGKKISKRSRRRTPSEQIDAIVDEVMKRKE
jgi:uncharacterized RDD family membrane protein YckC